MDEYREALKALLNAVVLAIVTHGGDAHKWAIRDLAAAFDHLSYTLGVTKEATP